MNYFWSYLDQCPMGWLSFDNSCYKHESGLSKRADTRTANEYCTVQHDAKAIVLNSYDEVNFLHDYLLGVEV